MNIGYVGRSPRTRTLTNAFGERHATITSATHIKCPSVDGHYSLSNSVLFKDSLYASSVFLKLNYKNCRTVGFTFSYIYLEAALPDLAYPTKNGGQGRI